ncbi:hypothetical protein EsDP_00002575 [Epichloe bromicola]|uniref:Uncharacterized protein n=1 Tax=Epichloe bromicola TaxID=79588 RepID=A0ABQ0CL67_9HYPO
MDDSALEAFAEINDDTVVFSVGVEAPLKQIIADLARPLLVVSTGFSAFNDSEKPWADAESPRTASMWHQYHKLKFPVAPGDDEMMAKLKDIFLYVRKDLGPL